MAPDDPVAPGRRVAARVAERVGHRRALGVHRLRELEVVRGRRREGLEAGRFHVALAVDHRAAVGTDRQADPLLAAHAVVAADVVPAAVFLAEVFGHVGQRHQLIGVQMRIVVPAENDVGPTADVGRDRRFRPDVFEALAVDAHLDAVFVGELLRVRQPQLLVASDETLPAHQPQLGALFRLAGPGLRARFGGEQGGSDRAAADQKVASIQVAHEDLLQVVQASRSPLWASKR